MTHKVMLNEPRVIDPDLIRVDHLLDHIGQVRCRVDLLRHVGRKIEKAEFHEVSKI